MIQAVNGIHRDIHLLINTIMLIWDIAKYIRRSGGKVYLKPVTGLTDGQFIDYSEKEDLKIGRAHV